MTELTDKPIGLTSPLGDGVLKFLRMTASEELGRLFEFEIFVLSEKRDVAAKDLLGQPMTVQLAVRNDGTRYFHGFVTEFARVETSERTVTYRVVLRPKLWFLTQTSDCRIFQGKQAPEIVKTILAKHGVSDVEDRLNGEYRTWEYCVQYRETDFDFISRLMEQEGMYYYFKHEDSKNIMVLADSLSAHDTVKEYETVRFLDEATTSLRGDHITSWNPVNRIRPGKYVLNDFDFKNPKTKLLGQVSDPKPHAEASHEIFDHPGEYLTKSEGEVYAKIRLEELHAGFEVSYGAGYARGLGVGALFTLSDHPVEEQNAEYLITRATYELKQEEYEAGASAPQTAYVGNLSAILSKQPYRSPRTTPKPVVQGPQTAIVAGQGSPIYTDEYGRVKVQFHWDRHGGSDENSSCWIRVAQLWAGKNWGGMHIPEIGQEVIVEFLEGDPDRPIITGRVYNQDNMPPMTLPEHQLKSIIRDHYGNQIIFDATPGEEHIQIFSPHYHSMLEIGRSITSKSQDPMKVITENDYYSFVSGVTGSIFVGAKAAIGVGLDIAVTGGAGVSVFLGGKFEYAWGTQSSYFNGDKFESVKGTKVTRTEAKELRSTKENSVTRSGKAILLDSHEGMALNAGPADNSLLNMGEKGITLDFGGDSNPHDPDAEVQAATAARNAVVKTVAAWGAAGIAVAGLSMTAEGIWGFDHQKEGDANNLSKDFFDGFFGIGGPLTVLGGGALFVAMKAWAHSDKGLKSMAESTMKEDKYEQEKTRARIKLFADGIKIQTFDGEKLADDSDTSEIFLHKDGGIDIMVMKKGKPVNVKSDGDLTLASTNGNVIINASKDVKLNGANITLEATSDVTAKPMVKAAP